MNGNNRHPFLRWAGGKQWLVNRIEKYYNGIQGKYYEPFIGGGSLFFFLKPSNAILGDTNFQLIDTYRIVRDYPNKLIQNLEKLKNDEETYYRIREQETVDDIQRAASFIFLNKTCWNGLYRVNKQGKFNVPFGNNKREIFSKKTILNASDALQSTELVNQDFEITLENVEAGDFVYLDPPYTVLHSNNGFRHYNEKLFTWNDQKRLARIARKLVDKKCKVLISNAAVDEVVNLYNDFDVIRYDRQSVLAAQSNYRRKIQEVLIISNN